MFRKPERKMKNIKQRTTQDKDRMYRNKKIQTRILSAIIACLMVVGVAGCGQAEDFDAKDQYTETYVQDREITFEANSEENFWGGTGQVLLSQNFFGIIRKVASDETTMGYMYQLSYLKEGSSEQKTIDFTPQTFNLEGDFFSFGTVSGTDEIIALCNKITFTNWEGESGSDSASGLITAEYSEWQAVFLCPTADTKETKAVQLDDSLFEEGQPLKIMADKEGNIYMQFANLNEGGYIWKVLDSKGELVAESEPVDRNYSELTALPDGKVGILHTELAPGAGLGDLNTAYLYEVTKEGKENLLVSCGEGELFIAMQNDEWIVYANGEGVYKKSLSTGESILLYLWYQHGISFPEIYDMQIDGEGRVEILLNKEDTVTYIRLSPEEIADTPIEALEATDVEPVQITFLGAPYTDYKEYIVEFQKLYPQYSVVMVSYPEEQRLLTELTAGEGPVLIDTSNVDFTNNIELWECLDEEMAASGLQDDLLDKVLACGQIDGKQYGLTFCWTILTFGTMHQNISDWNHEEYIAYIKEHEEVESLFSEQNPSWFIRRYFFKDLYGCPFIDMETKTANLDSPEFIQLLKLADTKAKELEDGSNWIADLDSIERVMAGTRLGDDLYINYPATISWDITIYGENLNIIGFPGVEGSEHYVNGGDPMVIRKTATDAEKEAAFTFMEFLLSYDVQKKMSDTELQCSARRDVFEEQLAEIPEHYSRMTPGSMEIFEQTGNYEDIKDIEVTIAPEVWTEEFWKLYDKLKPYPTFPEELTVILDEELDIYFGGGKSAEETAEILQNRVQLWMDENL